MSNLIQIVDNRATTTSLAIAEGVQRPHKNIIELIRQHREDFEAFGPLTFETRVIRSDGKGGQKAEIAILNEHQATTLITFMRNIGVVKEFKKRLVKAFFDMRDELNRRKPENLSRMDILKMAMDSEQERVRLEGEIVEQRPKVEFYDEFVNRDGLFGLQNAGRALHQPPNKFIQWLKQTYLFYQGGALVAKARYIQQGLFETKTEIINDKPRPQTWITPKGLQYFASKLQESAA
ncbi:phage antirepressor KilAC domain-containing protein [Microbulbifer epialgicus]|uniref:Phage antirepressor KilAC domain-containing protein n=1 Tax=Microbulbifer epialgicus TaxID=393907 RepID=A0ABV4P3K0_9GAMM